MNEQLPEGEHDYHFIGKVGNFCPIKPGCGGGMLMREGKDKEGNAKYDSATGTIGYRWLESELVAKSEKEADIDRNYYRKLVDDAKDAIAQYGDVEWFISDTETEATDDKALFEVLPWKMACGRDTCYGCPSFYQDKFHIDCEAGYDISDLKSAFEELEKQSEDFAKR